MESQPYSELELPEEGSPRDWRITVWSTLAWEAADAAAVAIELTQRMQPLSVLATAVADHREVARSACLFKAIVQLASVLDGPGYATELVGPNRGDDYLDRFRQLVILPAVDAVMTSSPAGLGSIAALKELRDKALAHFDGEMARVICYPESEIRWHSSWSGADAYLKRIRAGEVYDCALAISQAIESHGERVALQGLRSQGPETEPA